MLDIVRARFGKQGLRVVQLLRGKGKMEQLGLEKDTMIGKKPLQLMLGALHTAGFVDLQEVPRDSTRAPIKTIYLWFFDDHRVRTKIIEDCYKAMVRTLQRAKYESQLHQNVITKSQRTDVAENEDEMLSPAEKTELEEWRKNDTELMVELERLDAVVFCLRDF